MDRDLRKFQVYNFDDFFYMRLVIFQVLYIRSRSINFKRFRQQLGESQSVISTCSSRLSIVVLVVFISSFHISPGEIVSYNCTGFSLITLMIAKVGGFIEKLTPRRENHFWINFRIKKCARLATFHSITLVNFSL